uniref:Putative chemokine ligand 18a n=1 Tax=Ctenopharyngodon idella TaxID=7959 RepID=A0A345W5V3_CTEID|nr:putative chemokine ligand 18a [Ctenopharyngodon idella]
MYGVFILHQTPPAEIKDRPSQGGIHALKAKCPPHCMLMKHNEWPHGPRTCSQIIAPLIPHKLIQTPHKSLRVETGLCNGSLSIKEHHKNILYDLINLCQLAAGTCEIVTLDRDSSQPRRTIARQTARCACKKGQIAGTTRARPACVDVCRGQSTYRIIHRAQTQNPLLLGLEIEDHFLRVLEYFHCTFLLSDMYFSDDDSPLDHSGLFYLQSTPKRLADGPANVLLLLFVHVKSESLIGLESSCLWQTFTVKGYGLFGITLVLKRAGGSGAMAKVDFSLHLVLPFSGRAHVSAAESTVLLPRQPRATAGLVIGLWGAQPVVTVALVKTFLVISTLMIFFTSHCTSNNKKSISEDLSREKRIALAYGESITNAQRESTTE